MIILFMNIIINNIQYASVYAFPPFTTFVHYMRFIKVCSNYVSLFLKVLSLEI